MEEGEEQEERGEKLMVYPVLIVVADFDGL